MDKKRIEKKLREYCPHIQSIYFMKSKGFIADEDDEIIGITIHMQIYETLELTYSFVKFIHELLELEDFNIEHECDSEYGEYRAWHNHKYHFWYEKEEE